MSYLGINKIYLCFKEIKIHMEKYFFEYPFPNEKFDMDNNIIAIKIDLCRWSMLSSTFYPQIVMPE